MSHFNSQNTFRSLNFLNQLIGDLPDQFRRARCWGPGSLWMTLLMLTRPSGQQTYRFALSNLPRDALSLLGWVKAPCAASLSQARRKLKVETCRSFIHLLVDRLWSW